MALSLGAWIHIFTVTDTMKHKGGFTIYKITSIVFPRSLPQALTCLTVWRRFHDVKRLHRELSRRHKSLHLPVPTDASFFKRFDSNVIQRRKEYILQLLDFIAQQPALYKSHAFSQFFSDAENTASGLSSAPYIATPALHTIELGQDNDLEKTSTTTTTIAANIHTSNTTPEEEEVVEDEKKILRTNSTLSELSITTPKSKTVHSTIDDALESAKDSEPVSSDHRTTRFLTPMASIESDDSDYIYEAALEFSRGVEAEANVDYRDAYKRYKRGVELLLNGVKDDANEERKFIAKTKVTKYLARADDIYEKFLLNNSSHSDDQHSLCSGNFQLSIDVADDLPNNMPAGVYLERPWNNLAKYKVVRILGDRVMQVQCITDAQRSTYSYVMKGIEKPASNSPTQSVFLPQNVPYMVNLLAFFQSEQKIFLLLRHAEGGRLCDYIDTYTPKTDRITYAGLFPDVDGNEAFSDTSVPPSSANVNDLVRYSEELLQSVSNTLDATQSSKETKSSDDGRFKNQCTNRKIPEASLKQWASELAVAIHSLHSKGLILRDLNMENLLLGGRGQLLLTYFYQNEGLDTSNNNHVHKSYSPQALMGHFVAPENPLTLKSDWWSYGVVLYNLLTGMSFKSAHPGQIDLYGSVQYPDNIEISDQARDLLENLLQQTPEDRYSYDRIQTHPFFNGTCWHEVERNGVNSNYTNNKLKSAPNDVNS